LTRTGDLLTSRPDGVTIAHDGLIECRCGQCGSTMFEAKTGSWIEERCKRSKCKHWNIFDLRNVERPVMHGASRKIR